ncbi:transglutaminase family protein [Bermanella sp. R86510]|uniref:transglutaminase-like domain-containing protein n=1 Tax=unclassified Bermanella TaxID=2627862 RepID=UPI0037CB6A9D
MKPMSDVMQSYLEATEFFDFNHPEVQQLSAQVVNPEMGDKEKAVALYYAVRDGVKYNPYVFSDQAKSLSASYCLEHKESYCIPKAVLLGAVCRLNGIPSRLGLADVKNHLSSEALIKWLRSDVFVMHGYIELYINGRWVKATPAFDKTLCERMGVAPLEFNGEEDSVFHEFNGDGHRAMEYLADHGQFDDVPFDFIVQSVVKAYPHLTQDIHKRLMENHSLEQDLEQS